MITESRAKTRPRPAGVNLATRHDEAALFSHPAFPFVSGLLVPLLRLLLRVLLHGLLLRPGVVDAQVRRQEEEEQPQEGQEWRQRCRRCRPEEVQLHLQGRHQVRDRPKVHSFHRRCDSVLGF